MRVACLSALGAIAMIAGPAQALRSPVASPDNEPYVFERVTFESVARPGVTYSYDVDRPASAAHERLPAVVSIYPLPAGTAEAARLDQHHPRAR